MSHVRGDRRGAQGGHRVGARGTQWYGRAATREYDRVQKPTCIDWYAAFMASK